MKNKLFYTVIACAVLLSFNASAAYIMRGELSPPTAWAVQVIEGGVKSCTGVAVSAKYILTARHCVNSGAEVTVHYSTLGSNNLPANDGVKVAVKNIAFIDNDHDIALLPLVKEHPLASYAQVSFDYDANQGDTGLMMGYGPHDNVIYPQGTTTPLYQAKMTVQNQPRNILWANADTGSCNPGDSGGPLIIGNKVVAVTSGMEIDTSKFGRCGYAAIRDQFSDHKSWFNAVLKK
ncbi:S1 family peptidase [Serratia sp. M24T3]|uniref:S1 family peptidase n=1 Tax=Serratia sp. M24T3 TaxID=932213 RepID=UPI00025BB41C|nr:S1 family peptidase [Serratia sp. M24T3]EIC85359.1 secretory serine protease [Serratia sp. M24T3]